MSNEDLQQIQALVSQARNVLIFLKAHPTIDATASALSLSLAFSKMGKTTTVLCETFPTVELGNLVGINKVQTTMGGKNLTLTYKPYNSGDFEKVLYPGEPQNPAEGFKLVIVPKDGVVPDVRNFNFSFSGGTADLIITVDVLEPTLLNTLYDQNLFASAPVINIDNHDPNKDYGRFNLVEPDAASVSEITTFFLRAVNIQLDQDIAGNLQQGLIAATNNFQSPTITPATFEAAAICMRAKKPPVASVPAAAPVGAQPPVQPVQPVNVDNNVPQDWTQPKIYHGSGATV